MRAKIQQGKGGEKREKVVVVKGEERGGKVTEKVAHITNGKGGVMKSKQREEIRWGQDC